MFHAAAYQLAVRHYQPQLGSIISLKEPFLSRGCRMSVDPDAYYNPDAVAIRIEQPLQMPDGGDLKIVPSPVRDPLEMMAPGADRNGQIATLFSVILMEMTRRFQKARKMISNCCSSTWRRLAAGLEYRRKRRWAGHCAMKL